MFRLSSDLVPFASHEVIKGIKYLDWIKPELKKIGQLCKDNNIRISAHPSQIVNINSPSEKVVKDSIKDLIYHYNILNNLGVQDFDIIIHVGGVYGDKIAAMKRFIRIFNKLPQQLRNHIVLENDDKSYNINDVMKIYKYTGVKVCLDIHHAYCLNDYNIDLKAIFDTWGTKTPKIHMSSPKSDKEFRSHSEYIDINYCKDFLRQAEQYTYDIMVEAKGKDNAVEKFKKDYLNIK
jgi:UV DNA damage endonuclease